MTALARFFDERLAWSIRTFGPGDRHRGILAHIRLELDEIAAKPADLEEWIDVVLIAMDGAGRSADADGRAFVAALEAKAAKNAARTWPDWRTQSPNEPTLHVRDPQLEDVARESAVDAMRATVARQARDLAAVTAANVANADELVEARATIAKLRAALSEALDDEAHNLETIEQLTAARLPPVSSAAVFRDRYEAQVDATNAANARAVAAEQQTRAALDVPLALDGRLAELERLVDAQRSDIALVCRERGQATKRAEAAEKTLDDVRALVAAEIAK